MEENPPLKNEELIQRRKEKIVQFIKKDSSSISYVLLAIITFIAVKIRTANLPRLRDITTGDWTLGPDLDPFLFLRWAKYIVDHGTLMAIDTMRYVPLGFDTSYELTLHVYLITWFHAIATWFGSSSITQSAVIYPVFMFALAMIAFFFMTRKLFMQRLGKNVSNALALVASFFLAVTPALLPRTIAGIPEKEASGILFLFLAFYLFMLGWESLGYKKYIYGFLAGVATAIMGLVWGGYLYIIITIGPLIILAFILGKMDKGKKYLYGVWLLTTLIILFMGTKRYSLTELLTSTTTLPCIFALFLIIVDGIIFDTKLKSRIPFPYLAKIPRPLFSLIVSMVIGLVGISIVLGPSFAIEKVLTLKKFLVTTAIDRLNVTVAENRQPYFIEWAESFGPIFFGIRMFFWLFFIGAIMLFYQAVHTFKQKDRVVLTVAFTFFLSALIFSRYSGSSMFNGVNGASLVFYALGPLVLLVIGGYYYYHYYKSGEHERLVNIEFGYLFVLSFFLISLISARGGVRLVMMLVPAASILAAYLTTTVVNRAWSNIRARNKNYMALVIAIILALATIYAGYIFYRDSTVTASQYVPTIYNQQWQKAMAWVREETPTNAVFGHWWDYGYWVQSIGERATVLDGGNAKSYWNHMMGRYALTGTSNQESLEFLYAHNTTHFLIDSSDIGKYGAFSSIGSDKEYDRLSYLSLLHQDPTQIQEKKNSTLVLYAGGFVLDEDILYEVNGTQMFLPANKAGVGAIVLERENRANGKLVAQPEAIFVYQNQQYRLPLRYAYDGTFKDFGTGIEAGIFLMPRIVSDANGVQVLEQGSMIYLSSRTVNSQFARLYMYNEANPHFKLVHSEDDFIVAQVKAQVQNVTSDFVYYDAVRGPIRIWEIQYPRDIVVNPAYLSEEWPPELLRI